MIPMRSVLNQMKPYVAGQLVPGKIKLASNENPLGPSPKAMAAFADSATRLHLYPDGAMRDLKTALAEFWHFGTDQVVVGNGSDEVLVMIAAAFINPGDHVLVGRHTFSEYRFASLLLGAEVESVAMNQGHFDLTAFRTALRPNTKAVFLCSPNNPTGTLIGRSALETFLSGLPEGVLVVLDAAYSEYVDDPAEAGYPFEKDLLPRFPNLVVLHTFSKLYGLAGLRLGYGLAAPDLIAAVERTRQPFNVSLPAQAAGIAALQDTDFVARSLAVNRAGKAQLMATFADLSLAAIPTQGNFICVETGRDAQEVFKAVMAGGVTIRPLTSFGLPTAVRVTIGTAEQNAVCIEAFRSVFGR